MSQDSLEFADRNKEEIYWEKKIKVTNDFGKELIQKRFELSKKRRLEKKKAYRKEENKQKTICLNVESISYL